MRRLAAGLLLAVAAASTAAAQAATSVARLLADGYEIKTAFADTAGGAYIILQKGTAAYLCHSAPRQTCEKMN